MSSPKPRLMPLSPKPSVKPDTKPGVAPATPVKRARILGPGNPEPAPAEAPVKVRERVQERVLAVMLEVAEQELTLRSRLVEDLGADHLDLVEIAMDLEAEFDIEIPDGGLEFFDTFENLLSYIEKTVERKNLCELK